MAKKLFSIMLLLCSVFNSFSEEMNMEWVHKDEAFLRSTLDFIEKNDFTDSSIRKFTGTTNKKFDSAWVWTPTVFKNNQWGRIYDSEL